jgi:hypothetical protein
MKPSNNAAILLFSIIGLTSFIGAIFFGAHRHIATAIVCVVMILVFVADNKRENE